MGVTVSSSHVVSAAPYSSGVGLLTLCPCSSVGSLTWETVLHKVLQHESFPWAAALHKLPQHRSFHGVQSFRNRLLQHGSPTGSQALPANLLRCGVLSPRVHRFLQEPAPVQALHGVTASFRHPRAPAWCPFHGRWVDICSTMDLHGLQGDNLPHHGLHRELQEKTLCSCTWSTCCSCFFNDLGACRIVSLTSSHSSQCRFTAVFFLLLLKYVTPERLPPSLMGLALGSSRSILEPAGTGLIRHGRSFSQKPPL